MTKTIHIDLVTLKSDFFVARFKEPIMGEVYYIEKEDGWILDFFHGNYYIQCYVKREDLLKEIPEEAREDKEARKGKLASFETVFLKNAIKVERIGDRNTK